MNKDFWNDVLRSGAILGIVMSLSVVFERYVLAFSDMSIMTASVVYFIEWFVVMVAFVWLIVFFVRRRGRSYPAEVGFSYSTALSYILLVSMLAGIVVGVATTVYINAMGYDNYIEGVIGRMEELVTLYESMGIPSEQTATFGEYADQMRYTEQPSILANVFGSLQLYMLAGGIPGLIIAGIVSRRPKLGDFQN